MVSCKKCGLEEIVKSGIIRGRQRFRCKKCGCNFRLGDNRTNQKIVAKKALCILWYSTSKGSYRTIGKLLQIKHTLVHRWIHEFSKNLPEPQISDNIQKLEFNEIWHFVDLKKENFESLKQLIAIYKKQLPESLINAILQHLNNSTIK
jgi:transposase